MMRPKKNPSLATVRLRPERHPARADLPRCCRARPSGRSARRACTSRANAGSSPSYTVSLRASEAAWAIKVTRIKAVWLQVPIPLERQHLSDFGRADTFDIALWYILGKSLGTPVWQLLAGAAPVVFDAVPLGDDHPYWQMPNVQITPTWPASPTTACVPWSRARCSRSNICFAASRRRTASTRRQCGRSGGASAARDPALAPVALHTGDDARHESCSEA